MSQPAAGQLPAARRQLLHRVPVVLAAVWLAIDQLTKNWAVGSLVDRDVHVVWTLQFNLTFNSGMAFSRGQGWGPVIGVLALVVIVVLVLSLRRPDTWPAAIAAGLLVGGAAGNVADRIFRGDGLLRGSVVDFIDFQWFPIFNVADVGINIGGGLMVLSALVASRTARRDAGPMAGVEHG